jgi:hypothetical protein
MKDDLVAADGRVDRIQEAAVEETQQRLASIGTEWSGEWSDLGSFDEPAYEALEPETRRRLRQIRIDLSRSIARSNEVVGRFPERFLAGAWDVHERANIPLNDAEQQLATDLDSSFVAAALNKTIAWIGGGIGLLIAVLLTVFGFGQVKDKRYIEHVPTSKSRGLAYGLAELSGTIEEIEGVGSLPGPVSKRPCAHYRHLVEELKGTGKRRRWVKVTDDTRFRAFICRDTEGGTVIVADGAEVYTKWKTKRRVGRMRYTEWRLEIGDPIYALGSAEIDAANGASLYLAKGDDDFPFILSNRTESEVMRLKSRKALLRLNLAQNGAVLAALLWFGASGSFAASDYLAAAMVSPIYQAVLLAVLMFNDLIFLRQRVDRAWANIDVSLKKRFDLVPRLEAVVKKHFEHEKELLEAITQLRSGLADTGNSPSESGALLSAEDQTSNSSR